MAERRAARPVRARTSGVELPGATLGQLCDEIPGAAIERGRRDARVRQVRRTAASVEPGDLLVLDDRALSADAVGRALKTAARRRAAAVARTDARADDAPGATVAVMRVPDPRAAAGIAASAVWGHPSFSVDVLACVGDRGTIGSCASMLWAYLREAFGGALVGQIAPPFVYPPARGAVKVTPLFEWSGAPSLARELASMRDARAEYVVVARDWDAVVDGALLGTNLRAVITAPTRSTAKPEAARVARIDALVSLGAPAYVVDVDDAFGRGLHARLARGRRNVYTVSGQGATEADAAVERRGRDGVMVRMGKRRVFVPVKRPEDAVMPLATMGALGGDELVARVEYVVPPGTPRHQRPALVRLMREKNAAAGGEESPR